MKYENFEDVPVWNDGVDLTAKVFEVTEDPAFRGRGDIANQIQRAALSVPNNISKGSSGAQHQNFCNSSIMPRALPGRFVPFAM